MHRRRFVLWGVIAAFFAAGFLAKDALATAWIRHRLQQLSPYAVDLEQAQVRLAKRQIDLQGLGVAIVRPNFSAQVDVQRLRVRFDVRSLLSGALQLDYVICDIASIEITREEDVQRHSPAVTAVVEETQRAVQRTETQHSFEESASGALPIRQLDLRIGLLRYRQRGLDEVFQQIPLNFEESFYNIEHPQQVIHELLQKPVMGQPLSGYLAKETLF